MAADDELDLSGVTLDISGSDLIDALMPHIIQKLTTDQSFATKMVQALLPQIRTAMLQAARGTGNSLGQWAGS